MTVKSVLLNKKIVILVTLLSGLNLPVWAQDDAETMPEMDHSTMPGMPGMPGMDHSTTPQNDKDSSTLPAKDAGQEKVPSGDTASNDTMKTQPMNHDNMPGMQHSNAKADTNNDNMGDMNMDMDYSSMQGGTAPENARDPNAYSDGITLDSGPYALPGPRQLRMADEHSFASLLVDRLEAVHTSDETIAAFDIQAWYGRDYDRAVLKVEGEYDDWQLQETSTDLLWSHAISAYWNSQLGISYDHGDGPDRTWLAFGVQGLAPYWFEMDINAYVGENGRTSLSFESEYEILLTQKIILQPRLEAQAYGKEDIERGIGAGLSEASLGLRLRYEAWREWAPYFGLEWVRKFGDTADIAKAEGLDQSETRVVAGVRYWF